MTATAARYLQLTVSVATQEAEAAAGILCDITGTGVWVEHPFTQADAESDAVVDVSRRARIHAYVSEERVAADWTNDVRAALDRAGVQADVQSRYVAEEQWADAWKEFFHVERYGRIVVVPSWREYDPQPGDVTLTLDPGMAFGTGQHETTRMCLEALDRHVRPGMRVLDVGSGSGILAVAAARLGARSVTAVDIDPVCVRVTQENAAANGVGGVVEAREGSLGAQWPFGVAGARGFDIVVANILAGVIIDMARELALALAPRGRLIASGIIARREQEVAVALAAAGLRVEQAREMGEWRCIEAVLP